MEHQENAKNKLDNAISSLIKEIRDANKLETKRALAREMGERRDALYEITGDLVQKRLAENCYRVAQTGFKSYE
jgi:hypothetical protein